MYLNNQTPFARKREKEELQERSIKGGNEEKRKVADVNQAVSLKSRGDSVLTSPPTLSALYADYLFHSLLHRLPSST